MLCKASVGTLLRTPAGSYCDHAVVSLPTDMSPAKSTLSFAAPTVTVPDRPFTVSLISASEFSDKGRSR